MNDFTKKELLALEDAMQNMLEMHKPQDGISPLLNKLQSMIDNYKESETVYCKCFGQWVCDECHFKEEK